MKSGVLQTVALFRIVPNDLHTDRDLIGEKLPLRLIDRAEQTVRNMLNVFAISSQDIASGQIS